MKNFISNLILLILSLSISCKRSENTLFLNLSSAETGIEFSNIIYESDSLNILNEEYIYNGGGVGVGDFNNDGLPDLYFTGNMVSNKLYLNQGDFKFQDVTERAKVTGEGRWCSGVAVVDINNDGFLDIYVSATLNKNNERRRNLLYINQGIDLNKVPVFKELSAQYGLNDDGGSTQSAFLDYDLDGDLDLYVLTNIQNEKIPVVFRNKIDDGTALNNDRLYRNNGNGTFTDVSKEAGIRIEGYGLGITVSDINLDGWPDIYIANDYMSNDLLYINNQDGTFSNKINDYLKHTCFSAMGTDVVDVNNDGLVDIIALDMLPEDNQRKKLMVKDNNYITYINFKHFDYQHQYVRNVLNVNQGFNPSGYPSFSEVGQLAGIYQTDWSWAPIVADFDNDGQRDIIITNGFPRDVTDRDFISYRSGPAGRLVSNLNLSDSIPQVKIPNYAYKNKGNVQFENVTKSWGLDVPSFSNGGVYCDLDNDGDLDVVINNINDKASIYKNQSNDLKKDSKHYVRIKLKGLSPNINAIGTKINLYANGGVQYYEHYPVRGYLSSVEAVAHFGLGNIATIDSLHVFFPDGTFYSLKNLSADSLITVSQSDAKSKRSFPVLKNPTPLFSEVSNQLNVNYKHKEEDKIDFNIQRTIPHKLSQNGPGIAVGDIDGDGLDDFYVGSSAGHSGTFFKQKSGGKFEMDSTLISDKGNWYGEDAGCLFFDSDNDNDLDLFLAKGSYEFEEGSVLLKHQLFKNDGKGHFSLDSLAIPDIRVNGSCVRSADFDGDGDLDLFIGGRVVSGKYPSAPESYILENNNGIFSNVTPTIAPDFSTLGMITDALWTDFDNDGKVDLVITGEWMPVTFFKNIDNKFRNVTAASGVSDLVGWWNSLTAGDFDNDGDIDYIAGNLGLNTNYKASKEQPLSIYGKDFDNNGRFKAILSCYIKSEDGQMKPFPMHTRDDLFIQMPTVKKKFSTYGSYSNATMDKVLTDEERKGAIILSANYFSSSYLENLGNGKFKMKELPIQSQYAPVNGMVTGDFNEDGNLDVLVTGNNYSTEVFTGRYDAMVGLLLEGDGQGNFDAVKLPDSGFFVDGDAKGLSEIYVGDKQMIIATQNRGKLKLFATNNPAITSKSIELSPLDFYAIVTDKNGKQYRKEFYYGSTYLSQSTRKLKIGSEVASLKIISFAGEARVLNFN